MPDHAPLPDTIAELHALVLEQQASIAKMRQEIAERDREIVERDQELERLKAQIDKLRRMHFGRKSEQVDRQIDRLETQLEDLAAGSGVAVHALVHRAQARLRHPRRKPWRPICRAKSMCTNSIRAARCAETSCS